MAKKKRATKKATKKKVAKKPEPAKPAATKELRHYEEICALNGEVADARDKWQTAKDEAKNLKEIYETKCAALGTLISMGPDPQIPLNFEGEDGEGEATTPQAAWMARPLGVLELPPGLIKKLEEADILTIGQLDAFWKQGRVLTDLKGIGADQSGKIADAWGDYAKVHQEVYGMDDESEDED